MHMSGESLLVVLVVGLIAGWLAGQIVRGTASGSSATFSSESEVPSLAAGFSLSSACTSARALSWRSNATIGASWLIVQNDIQQCGVEFYFRTTLDW
jgi:hypothetical protein